MFLGHEEEQFDSLGYKNYHLVGVCTPEQLVIVKLH